MEKSLESLSVSDLKKRLFWVGASLPDGHIEKADLVAAVRAAEAEQEEKFAKKSCVGNGANGAGSTEQGVLRPEPRPLDFEAATGTVEEQQIVELHLLSEAQLKEKIEQNGHDVPSNSSKHYLVALCRKALKDPREPKPKKAEEEAKEPENAIAEYRRPTVGDRVQVRDTMIMKRYLPEAIGKVFRIFKDDGGAFPYRLAGVGEQRHWFSEDDICWPTKVQTKVFNHQKGGKANPDQPEKVMINHNRYGCTQGEVRDVLGETADKKSWVLSGGRQVPKSHEHSGWSRIQAEKPDGPPPPPPTAPQAAVTLSEAEIFAQMEEMQAQMEAQEAAQTTQGVQSVQSVQHAGEPTVESAQSSTVGTAAAGAEKEVEKPQVQPAEPQVSPPKELQDSATDATAVARGQEARRKRKEAAERKEKEAKEAEERLEARRKARKAKAKANAARALDVSDDEVQAVDAAISID